jgi:hypothetical protein
MITPMLKDIRMAWTSPFGELKNNHPDKVEWVNGKKVVHTLFPTVLKEYKHKDKDCSVLKMLDGSLVILLRCETGGWALDEFKQGLTLPEIKAALDKGAGTAKLCILDTLFMDSMDLSKIVSYLSAYDPNN